MKYNITNEFGIANWEETLSLNEQLDTVRNVKGNLVLKSNIEDPIPDSVKVLFGTEVLSVLPGFKRQSSNYSVSPDGLEMSYEIKDEEVVKD